MHSPSLYYCEGVKGAVCSDAGEWNPIPETCWDNGEYNTVYLGRYVYTETGRFVDTLNQKLTVLFIPLPPWYKEMFKTVIPPLGTWIGGKLSSFNHL